MALRNPFDVNRSLVTQQPQQRVTATQQRKLDEQRLQAETDIEIRQATEALQNSDAWLTSSLEARQGLIEDWERNQWPQYATQRFPNDPSRANQYRNRIINPLKQQLRQEREATDTWGNAVANLGQSVARGADTAYDMVQAVPVIIDTIRTDSAEEDRRAAEFRYNDTVQGRAFYPDDESYNQAVAQAQADLIAAQTLAEQRRSEFTQSVDNLAREQTQSALNEEIRRRANPLRAEEALREREILAQNPDAVVLWEQFLEQGPRPVVQAVLEQLPNIGLVVASSAGGAVVGGVAAGPAGAAAGGVTGASLSGALVTAASVANETIQEINSAPIEKIRSLPVYAELAAEGLDEAGIRREIARRAVLEVYPYALGIGAASGVLGPEALVARSSILMPLIKGGIIRRVATGGFLSGVEEFGSEYTEQVIQNQGWNVGTGDSKDLTDGAFQAGATGAIIGAVTGGVGGGLNQHGTTDLNLVEGSERAESLSPTPRSSQGQFITPEAVPRNIAGAATENPFYNQRAVERAEKATQFVKEADAQINDLTSSGVVVSEANTTPIFQSLTYAQDNGVSAAAIQSRLESLQLTANIPTDSNFNFVQAYNNYFQQFTGDPNAQLRQTSEGGSGTNIANTSEAGSGTAASQQGSIVTSTTPNNAEGVGSGATTESTGTGGTTYQNAGAVAENVLTDQPAGRGAASGTDSGRNNSGAGTTSAESNTGVRGTVSEAEQRSINDNGTEATGLPVQTGVTLEPDGIRVNVSDNPALNATTLNIAESLIATGVDPNVAMRNAEMWGRGMDSLINESPTQAIEQTTNNIENAATNYTVDSLYISDAEIANMDAQSVIEAMQHPVDMTSPLAMLGNTSDATFTELVAGVNRPEVVNALNPTQNGVLHDAASETMRDGATYLGDPVQPTVTEQVAESAAIADVYNELVAESGVDPVVAEVNNPDGSSTFTNDLPLPADQEAVVNQVADQILADYNLTMEAARRGIDVAASRVNAFNSVVYAPEWRAGLYAKGATEIRNQFVDGGAWFRTEMLKLFSSANTNPESTPIIQSFQNLTNSVSGAASVVMQNATEPYAQWCDTLAANINADPQTVMFDMGKARTLLHTIEAAPRERVLLYTELQQAYLLPDGPEKQTAVMQAEEALRFYDIKQSGNTEGLSARDIRRLNSTTVYGGRTVQEAQAELNGLIAEYGEAVVLEGATRLGEAQTWVTRFGAENGVISTTDVEGYSQWNWYIPLTTPKENGTGSVNGLSAYTPRLNFHRYGSLTPAQDGFSAFQQYASRVARNTGMADFNSDLNQVHTVLQESGVVTNTESAFVTVNGNPFTMQVNYYNGLAKVDSSLINGILYGGGQTNSQAYAFAKSLQEKTDVVIRVSEVNEAGENVIKSYNMIYDEVTHPKVKAALRFPFAASSPNSVSRKFARITSNYASIYTRLKLAFPAITGVRDTIERVSYLPTRNFLSEDGRRVSGVKIAAQMLGFLSNPFTYYHMARYFITGNSGNAYINAQLSDFFSSGTSLSGNYNRMLNNYRAQTVDEISANMPAQIRRSGAQAVQSVMNVISTWGDFFYSLPSFAQFIKMRENGISMRDTVDGVTNLMNMQQRGRLTSKYLAPFFPFTNSIGQTAANLVGALGFHTAAFSNHPNAPMLRRNALKGWAVMVVGYSGVRALMPLIASALGDGDQDEGQRRLDLIPLAQLSTYIPIGVGNGDHFKWPTGFGPIFLSSMLAYGIDRYDRGKISAGDLGATIISSFGKTLIPNSAPAFEFSRAPVAYIVQTMSPMLLQPAFQVAMNTSYSGAPIRTGSYDAATPRSEQYKLTTHRNWVAAAKALYQSTGVDMAPEEIKALTSGYLGGALQAVVSWIESDPLYSDPTYQSTREALGPVWTALGATSIYNKSMNLSQSSMYAAKNYYDGRIRRAGISDQLTGAPSGTRASEHRRNVLLRNGFSSEEANDYAVLYQAQQDLTKLNTDFRKQLDPLFGRGMDEDLIKSMYQDWSTQRHNIQESAVQQLSYYNRGFRARYDAQFAEVDRTQAEAGNIDLNARPVLKNPDGTISTVESITFQEQGGLYVNIPTITPEGNRINNEDAIRLYYLTGQHLGKYRSEQSASQAAERLSARQADMYAN